MTNMDKLYEAVAARGPVCVGLDTDFSYLPADFVDTALTKGENIVRFNKKLIDATKAVAGCYKVQIAYYESLGLEGMKAYAETLAAVREAGIPVIADIKRGDIAKTAEMYAMGHFTGDFESDFVTLAPYMGLDSISPYLPYAEKQGKGMFVLCRTSNGGAKDFEYEKLADGRHVYDLVGDKLNALGKDYMGEHGYSSIGLVIGGTHIEEATEIRAKYQDSFFLIPGYGAQGGKAEDIAQYLTKGNGGVVNSSRGILLAYKKQPGVGDVLTVRPEDGQQADVLRDDLMAQDSGLTAGCTHGQWPPSCSHTRCKRPRRRLRPAASCRPAGCRGWS